MAQKPLLLTSDVYHAKAVDALKGMAWITGLSLFVFPHGKLLGFGLLALAAILMVVGTVMYVFSHQSKMLEAQDALNALPKQSPPA